MIQYDQYPERDLAAALAAQWQSDLSTVKRLGIYPPWQLEPDDLQQDEARLLDAITDAFGLPWSDDDIAVRTAAVKAMGLRSEVNAKALIERCYRLGYITVDWSEWVFTINLTMRGRDMLESYQDDVAAGIL